MTALRGLGGLGALGAALALVATLTTVTGCADEESEALLRPHVAPTRAADCVDLPGLGGDPGILLGTDWSGEHHDFADTATVYACVAASLGGRVSLRVEGSGIRVAPRVVPVDPSNGGIVPFRVTVSKGAAGRLRVVQQGDAGQGDLAGPGVLTDAGGWHFVPHP